MGPGSNPGGDLSEIEWRLVSSPDVSCTLWRDRALLAGIGLVYVGAVYAGLFVIVGLLREHIEKDVGYRYSFGSIFAPFKPSSAFWELVEMSIVIVLSAGLTLLSGNGAWLQLLFATVVIFGAFVLYTVRRPLIRSAENNFHVSQLAFVTAFVILSLSVVDDETG